MDCDAERFEQRGFLVVNSARHGEATVRRHEHPFAQAATAGEIAAEVEMVAQVWMAVFALLAMAARLRRVHGNACAGFERLEIAVGAIWSDSFHHAGEFVTDAKRLPDDRIANASVLVEMQIAAANAGISACAGSGRLALSEP
jgi:hypothetical protein